MSNSERQFAYSILLYDGLEELAVKFSKTQIKRAELKPLYRDHDYEQGALLGIIELRERFNLLKC